MLERNLSFTECLLQSQETDHREVFTAAETVKKTLFVQLVLQNPWQVTDESLKVMKQKDAHGGRSLLYIE